MSGAKWTNEQLTAITARDCNLLVAAAAGAGKTAVLVERLIRRITDLQQPIDVDRLLVVTFTKASAAEMRERIGIALAKELNRHPGSRHLHRQVTLLNKSAITTLHSFCLDILKQYFYRLDLDPVFRVADDTEAALLRLEALEELLEEQYTLGEENFLKLVDAYGGSKDDSLLQDMILKLAEFSSSNPWPELWLQTVADQYAPGDEVEPDALPWTRSLLEFVQLQLIGMQSRLERALQLAVQPGGPEVYVTNLRADLQQLVNLLQDVDSFKKLYKAFQSLEFGKLKACRDKNVDDRLRDQVKNIRDEVKKKVTKLQQEFFSRNPAEQVQDLRKMAPLVNTLAGLVIEFGRCYRVLKKAKGLVDFSDLEHYCLAILLEPGSQPEDLRPSAVALELREHFEEVLVDEYQDTNAVQETILRLVSRQGSAKPNMFMVGDVKQSIYRFRLAEPGLFLNKYRTFPREAGECNRGVDLARNFRSRQGVVDGVNFVFRQIMSPRVGEMAYDHLAELVCGADYLQGIAEIPTADGSVELYLLEKKTAEQNIGAVDTGTGAGAVISGGSDESDGRQETEDQDADAGAEELDAVQREARVVAQRIQQLVQGSAEKPGAEFSVLDKASGSYRPVQYHDIVILMRASKGAANTFLEEFRQAGIPAYADLATGYFAATEVETMMSLLKVIDNPRQDIPLAAVLRSAIVGLTGEELAQVRLFAPAGEFYLAVKRAGQSAEYPKLTAFLAELEGWRTMARQGSLADLIWRLYSDTGYYAYVGTLAGGVQRQANLRALHDRARQYEATSFRGLFRFLRFIEKFQESGNDLGTARALGENEDVVRIISIHKSKGLEFPVVFVTGMGKQFNTNDLRRTALLHKELGLGLPVVDTELRLTYPSLAQTAVKKRLQMEALAEEMRILYVALTRAREKLILVGSVNDLEKCVIRWCENVNLQGWQLPDPDLAAAKNYLDWVVPAVARHRDGELLRRLAGNSTLSPVGETASDPSSWQVFYPVPAELAVQYPPEQEVYPAVAETAADSQQSAAADTSTELRQATEADSVAELLQLALTAKMGRDQARTVEEVFDPAILDWQYPYTALTLKPAKATVTEIKRRFADRDVFSDSEPLVDYTIQPGGRRPNLISRPRFMQTNNGLTPAEKGSAMHLVMQHLDLQGELSIEGIREQIAGFELAELLTGEQAAAVDVDSLANLFASALGKRITGNAVVKRELPFTLALPAKQVYPELYAEGEPERAAVAASINYEGEQILVQGVIDCLLDEGDGLVLIDYKTDQVSASGVEQLVANYRGQLNLYAHALETILKRPVKEKYLYLFATGQAVQC